MPLPFIVGALLLGAGGVLSVAGQQVAKETNEEANQIARSAQRRYEEAKSALDVSKKKAEDDLLTLGKTKKRVLDEQILPYIVARDKLRNLAKTQSVALTDSDKNHAFDTLPINREYINAIDEHFNSTGTAVSGALTGAATGAFISLAVGGALPMVGTMLSTAGLGVAWGSASLVATGLGAAISTAVSATPLAFVAAPALVVSSFAAGVKAEFNLDKAKEYAAEAQAAVEKMKVSESLCNAISKKATMFNELLLKIEALLPDCVSDVEKIITRLSSASAFWTNRKKLTNQEEELLFKGRQLIGVAKTILDVPILNEKGEINSETQRVYDHAEEQLIQLEESSWRDISEY